MKWVLAGATILTLLVAPQAVAEGGYAGLDDQYVTSEAITDQTQSEVGGQDDEGGVEVEQVAEGAISRGGIDRPPVRTFGDIEMSSQCAPDEARVEIIWIDPDTGDVAEHEGFRCLPRSQIHDDGGGAPPGASAEAPARDSVAEAIPDRVVRINPHPRGMTGMDTWLWYDDDGDEATAPTTELTVAASVPDVSVTATAAISSYCWDVDGDGSDEVCTDAPGSEQRPAFTHVYESTGTYEVHLTVTWAGTFSVNGAPPVAFDPVQRTYSIDYEVIQVRSVLTG